MRFLTIVLLCTCITVFSQEVTEETEQKKIEHSLGFSIGTTSGFGPTYRLMTASGVGFHISYMPQVETESYDYYYSESYHYIGLSLYMNVYKFSKTRLFIYQSNRHERKAVTYPYRYFYGPTSDYKKVTLYHGLGFGAEWAIKERGGFSLMGGMGAYKDFKVIAPTIETGIFYKL